MMAAAAIRWREKEQLSDGDNKAEQTSEKYNTA